MIVIAAEFIIQEGKRERAIELAQWMSEETKKEAGCHDYTFYADLDNPNKFFLFEEWEYQEHLDAHFKTEHMAEFRKQLPDVLAEQTKITRYVVTEAGTL